MSFLISIIAIFALGWALFQIRDTYLHKIAGYPYISSASIILIALVIGSLFPFFASLFAAIYAAYSFWFEEIK